MNDEEKLEILDDDGNVIKVIDRSTAEAENHTTKNVLVFLFNPNGHVWTQLRPMSKKHYPGLWDISACGGVVSGETLDEAVARETKEETGLSPKLIKVETFLNVFKGDDGVERKRMSTLFIGTTEEVPIANEEADEFKLWEPIELQKYASKKPSDFVPSFLLELKMALKAYKKQF